MLSAARFAKLKEREGPPPLSVRSPALFAYASAAGIMRPFNVTML